MHLIRLLKSGCEILEHNQVFVKREDKDFLLSIRDGKYTYDEYIKRQINKIKEFEVLSFNKEQELLEEEGVNDVTQLSPSAISKLDYFNQQCFAIIS